MSPDKSQSADGLIIDPERWVRFTTSEATKMSPDVSPDGRSIVFDILGDLYSVGIDGGTAKRLTYGMAVDFHPRWSPDSKRIAFISDRNGTQNLWVVDADGTNAQKLSTQDPEERPKTIDRLFTPTWSPDGQTILAGVATEKTSVYALHDIFEFDTSQPSAGKSVFGVSIPSDSRMGTEPTYSSDGNFIYYSRQFASITDGEIMPPWFQVWQYDLRDGSSVSVTDRALGGYSPSVSPDGRWLVYGGRDKADSGLRIRDLISGDDRWLLFPRDRDSAEDWTIGAVSNRISWAPNSKQIVTSFDGKLQAIKIPSGRYSTIEFEANVELPLGKLNRPTSSQLNVGNVTARAPVDIAVSPEGNMTAFSAFNRIYIADQSSGESRVLTDGRNGKEFHASWSPDGKKLVFTAYEAQSETSKLISYTLDGTETVLASTSGFLAYPSFTPNGEDVVFTSSHVNEDVMMSGAPSVSISSVNANGGPIRKLDDVPQGEFPIVPYVISRYPNRIFFDLNRELWSIDLKGPDRRKHITFGRLGLNPGAFSGGLFPTNNPPSVSRLSDDGSFIAIFDKSPYFGAVHIFDIRSFDLMSNEIISLSNKTDGRIRRRLTSALGGYAPSWSRTEKQLYFSVGPQLWEADPIAIFEKNASPKKSIRLTAIAKRRGGSGSLLLQGAKILTMGAAGVLPCGDILIKNNEIARVASCGQIKTARDVKRLLLSGKTVMPGMIDGHAHQFTPFLTAPSPEQNWQSLNRLAYGVTSIVDPSHSVWQFALADSIEAGFTLGPRMFGTGPIMHEYEFSFSQKDAEQIVSRQSDYFAEGVLKSYNIGGRRDRQRLLKAADEKGIIAIAENDGNHHHALSLIQDGYFHLAHGLAFPLYKDMRKLLTESGVGINYQFGTLRGEGGPSSIFYFLDEMLKTEWEKRIKFSVPRLYVDSRYYRRLRIDHDDHVFPYYSEGLESLIDDGILISLGDHSTFYGVGMSWETMALAHSMRDPLPALEAVTISAAKMTGLEKSLGSIDPGKLADLIIIDGDPSTNIQSLTEVEHVMVNGILYTTADMRQIWPKTESMPIRRWWADQAPVHRPGSYRSGGVSTK